MGPSVTFNLLEQTQKRISRNELVIAKLNQALHVRTKKHYT